MAVHTIKALDYQLTPNTKDKACDKTHYRMHSATFRMWEHYRQMLQFLHKYHARR